MMALVMSACFNSAARNVLKSKSILCSTIIPSRNTYVLKRRKEPKNLPRFSRKTHVIEDDHKMYDVIVDKNVIRKPDIQVLLTEFVEDLGKRGQIVNVRPYWGYDALIIMGKALYPTPENIEKIRLLSESELDKFSSMTAYKAMKRLKQFTLSLFMNMNEPWTIEPWHIRVTFRKQGVHILSDECIKLPDKPINGPDLTLEGKDFAITIVINNTEQVQVRCRLRHWSSKYSERIILPPDHYCIPSEAIFEEQEELLKSIPLPVYDPQSTTSTK